MSQTGKAIRRPIENPKELSDALRLSFPVGMFDKAVLDLDLKSIHDDAPAKRGGGLALFTGDPVRGEIDTWFYFPQELLVSGKDRLPMPLESYCSEELVKDLRLSEPWERIEFLFGHLWVAKEATQAGTTKVNFHLINDSGDAGLITHIMALKRELCPAGNTPQTFWTREYYGHAKDRVDYLYRSSKVCDNGERITMWIYPIGFRYVKPNNSDCFVIEETGARCGDFEAFKSARKEAVQKLCAGIMWKREDWCAESFQQDNRGETAESVALNEGPVDPDGMSSRELCEYLNAKLAVLREGSGLESLGMYEFGGGDLAAGRLSYKTGCSTAYHSRSEALRYVVRLERAVKAHAIYAEEFKKLRKRVEAIEGFVWTDNIYFAEFEMPQVGAFGPDGNSTVSVRFAYCARGVQSADGWLEEQEREFCMCLGTQSVGGVTRETGEPEDGAEEHVEKNAEEPANGGKN